MSIEPTSEGSRLLSDVRFQMSDVRFLIVQKQERELSQVAPTLLLLLEFGAQWINNALLENEKTPYHLICQSSGDHHELLDLMLLSYGRALLDTEDCSNRTALVYVI